MSQPETIVQFLRTRAKTHRAIGGEVREIRAFECDVLADELEAHPLPAASSVSTQAVTAKHHPGCALNGITCTCAQEVAEEASDARIPEF